MTSALAKLAAGVAGVAEAGVFALAGVAGAGLATSAAAGGLVCACAKVAVPTPMHKPHNKIIDADIDRKKVDEIAGGMDTDMDGACFILSPVLCFVLWRLLFYLRDLRAVMPIAAISYLYHAHIP